MTSISSLYADQLYRPINVNEAGATRSDKDEKSGSSVSTRTGDVVSISDEARQMLSQQLSTGAQGENGSSFESEDGASAGLGAGAAYQANAEASTQEQIKEIEKKIEKLGRKIAELQSQASSNPAAKAELDAKMNELAELQAQLAELKQQQS